MGPLLNKKNTLFKSGFS